MNLADNNVLKIIYFLGNLFGQYNQVVKLHAKCTRCESKQSFDLYSRDITCTML